MTWDRIHKTHLHLVSIVFGMGAMTHVKIKYNLKTQNRNQLKFWK